MAATVSLIGRRRVKFRHLQSKIEKAHNPTSSLFFCCCCWLSQCLVVCPILGDPFVSQNPISVWASHSPGPGLCIYHLFAWSSFNFLHNSRWITLPTQSYLVLHPFCANLLHSLIMWLIVSSLLSHNLLFCCALSIFAIRRDSLYLFIIIIIIIIIIPWEFFISMLAVSLIGRRRVKFRHLQSKIEKAHNPTSSLFFCCCCWLSQCLVVCPILGDPFVSQNPISVWASHSPGPILGCAYTIYLHGQASISCIIPDGSPCPPSRI